MSFAHPRRRLRLLVSLTATAAFAVGAVACGDDDEGDEAEPITEVTLTADEVSEDEMTFELSETPTAETRTVVFDNEGEQSHALIFARIGEGYTVDEAYKLEGRKGSAVDIVNTGARPGESTTAKVEEPLEPGHYAMLCPIGGPDGPHYKLGQLEEFDIE